MEFQAKPNVITRCDTTFEIIGKLWLTDTNYTNTTLVKTRDTTQSAITCSKLTIEALEQGEKYVQS